VTGKRVAARFGSLLQRRLPAYPRGILIEICIRRHPRSKASPGHLAHLDVAGPGVCLWHTHRRVHLEAPRPNASPERLGGMHRSILRLYDWVRRSKVLVSN